MTIKRISLLLLSIILVAGALVSCNRGNKVEAVEVTVDVKFVYKGQVIADYKNVYVLAEDGVPTIIDAVEYACLIDDLPYELTEDGMSLYMLGDYAETDTGLWAWKINGAEPDDNAGKAGAYVIQDGDKIEYSFIDLVDTTDTTSSK